MKKILALFLAILPGILFAQQLTEFKKISVSESFSSQESHSYNFYISNSDNRSKVKLILRGSDYDYDSDGDYTDFRITINGTNIVDIESLTDYGLGSDGTFNEISFDITSYVTTGTNEIVLENTENEGQVDYTYVTWLKVMTPGNSGGSELKKISVSKSFTAQTEKSYTFYLSSTSNVKPVQLMVRGSDYDYDNDGDFTDFTIEINGTAIIEIDPLANHDMGQNGDFNEISFDISNYIKSGTNTILLRNTEDQSQVDYTYITWLKIFTNASGTSNISSTTSTTLSLNKKFKAYHKFENGVKREYKLYLSSTSGLGNAKLVLDGYDYDYDNDADYTEFTISVNGTAITENPLEESGLGTNGSSAKAEFNIGSYLKTGNNIITLENTEVEGQVDYTYINSILVDEGSSSSSTVAKSTSNIYLNTKLSAYHKFPFATKREYKLYLSSTSGLSNARLIIDGYDYDYDNDGDFTEFTLSVNGNILTENPLKESGLGTNGSSAKAEFDIGSYLKYGNNVITLENTEVSGQTDYTYINSILVDDGKGNSNAETYTISLNNKYSPFHKFPFGTKKEYKLYVSSNANISNAKLILDGYDYDYDNDGDYTEFTLSVNGNILTENPLKESGLGTNGSAAKAEFSIENYLKTGNNIITLENTEVEGQTDYTYINSILVSNGSGGSNVISKTISINSPENINTKFTALSEMSISVYVSNSNASNSASLLLYGTDMDFDNDGDYTEFSVSINGNTLLNGSPLQGIGFGENGTYDYHTFDVGSYLNPGNNIITLSNVEAEGQTDYTFIKSVELRTQQQSNVNNTVANTPPAIEITEPNATRGFQVVQAQTVKVAGRAIDRDGISKVEVNGTPASLSSDGSFSITIPVSNGNNTIVVVATDKKYMSSTQTFTISNSSSSGTNSNAKLKKVALVIGNSAYQNASNLGMNPINDANDIAATLRALNFTVIKSNNADYAQLTQALKDFGRQNTDADVALVFYAGHGIQVDGKNYLLPTDVQLKDQRAVALECVSVENVQHIMETSNSNRLNLIILDACRNNPFLTSSRSTGGGLAEMNAPSGTLVAFSTSPGKVAANGTGRNGLYTGELIKQLKVSQRLEDVFINTRNEVEKKSGGQQSPWEVARLKGKYDLTK